jgi:hypothetical protein
MYFRGLRETHTNPLLVFGQLLELRKYQIIQTIHQYKNVDTHSTMHPYILPNPTSNFQNKTENKI